MPTDFNHLFLLASGQQGYFTASQAVRLGYTQQNQDRHVKAGNWNRISRGIFRLVHFPPAKHPDLLICHLWALDKDDEPTGVFSYETALQYYELSDWTGHGLHMTVPRGFRRHSKPPFQVSLHKENLVSGEIQKRDCFWLTTPLKTILDLLFHESAEERFLKQATKQAWARGLISKRHLETTQFTPWQADKVSWLLEISEITEVTVAQQ